jgi:hypothetical protein
MPISSLKSPSGRRSSRMPISRRLIERFYFAGKSGKSMGRSGGNRKPGRMQVLLSPAKA